VVFVETRVFTSRVRAHLSDEQYRAVQLVLAARPGSGNIVPGAGGLRKLRFGAEGRGKRGGIRLLYYWHPPTNQILLLFVFAKNERSDLTPRQREGLRKLIEREYP
jgi:hypothetical protein